jgi:hypothetical protein
MALFGHRVYHNNLTMDMLMLLNISCLHKDVPLTCKKFKVFYIFSFIILGFVYLKYQHITKNVKIQDTWLQ